MASQGPFSPSSAVNDVSVGSQDWDNPTAVYTANNVNASYYDYNEIAPQSDYLWTTGYGFSIPAGATIDGIVAEFRRHDYSPMVYQSCGTMRVRLIRGGALVGITQGSGGNWTATPVYEVKGNATEKWGETWTPAQINASNFGVAVQVAVNSGPEDSVEAYIDHVRITVYYTGGAGGGTPEDKMFLTF